MDTSFWLSAGAILLLYHLWFTEAFLAKSHENDFHSIYACELILHHRGLGFEIAVTATQLGEPNNDEDTIPGF